MIPIAIFAGGVFVGFIVCGLLVIFFSKNECDCDNCVKQRQQDYEDRMDW